jgi:hypothetical protein
MRDFKYIFFQYTGVGVRAILLQTRHATSHPSMLWNGQYSDSLTLRQPSVLISCSDRLTTIPGLDLGVSSPLTAGRFY